MSSWYKKSQNQQVSPQDDWTYRLERTFSLADFGRIKFRLRGHASDRNNRTRVMFESTPDPTLPTYSLQVRLDMNVGQIDILVSENGQMKGSQRVAVTQETLLQSPVDVANQVKIIIQQGNAYERDQKQQYGMAG